MSKLHKRLVIALAVSVGLNLFLLGLGTAHVLGRRDREWAAAEGRGPFGYSGLPRELRKQHRERLRPHRQAQRAARTKVREALLAEPFDKTALREALAGLRQTTLHSQEALHESLVNVASGLDREGRRRLSRFGGRGRGGLGARSGPRGHGGPGGPPGPRGPRAPDGAP